MLDNALIDRLYSFQNERKVFAEAHHAQKQVVMILQRSGRSLGLSVRFRLGVGDSPDASDIPNDLLADESSFMRLSREDVARFSPDSLCIAEIRSAADLRLLKRIYERSIRVGDKVPGWEISYAREFDMTNDSKHFPPLATWQNEGYRPDPFGYWTGPDSARAVPLFEGRMIGQFDVSQKAWSHGKGRTAVWHAVPHDHKQYGPQYLIPEREFLSRVAGGTRLKFAHMRIAASTNTRTMIGTVVKGIGCGDTAATISFSNNSLERTLFLCCALNSFIFDFVARKRVGGLHLDWHVVSELPIPVEGVTGWDTSTRVRRVSVSAAALMFICRQFSTEWLRLKETYPELAKKEWKQWWAVTEADRLRLRVEIDALCADLYGLEPDDFDWIVRDDPKDSKGFYRVDRQLPFRERLTGLAAAAFRALKEGKWSAESAANLSNDEFFALIGIPELTAGSEPLIRKRKGCHVWKPEEFGSDDPRHGWTWDHCWQDAVALLGSEEAVRKYIEGKRDSSDDKATDSTGQPVPPSEPRLF